MPDLTLVDFKGRLPRRSDRLLPDNAATVAKNVRLTSGELRGIKAPLLWYTFPDGTAPRRVFRVKEPDTEEFAWYPSTSERAELVKSPLTNDAFDRWYLFVPNQTPKIITFAEIQAGTGGNDLKVYAPTTAPTLSIFGAGTATVEEDRVYLYTYQTEYGEESAASTAATITCKTDATVTIAGLDTDIPSCPLTGRDYEWVNIYRSVVGNTSTTLRYVKRVAFGTASTTDFAKAVTLALNSQLPEYNDMPPSGLIGARVHPSGALVAFKGRQVYFSRPYLPHSWPEDWIVSLPDEIVGLEVMGQNIMVFTKGPPVVLYGSSPASIGLDVAAFAYPCLGYNTIVSTRAGIYFASEEGLCLMTDQGSQVISDAVMTREEWQNLCRSGSLRATANSTQYIATTGDGTGFVFDSTSGNVEFYTIEGLLKDTSWYVDRYSGTVGIIAADKVYQWEPPNGEESDYRYRTKPFYLPKPDNFEAIQVELEPRAQVYEARGAFEDSFLYKGAIDKSRQVVVRIWADGKFIHELVMDNRKPANLPRGFEATIWQVEIEGQCRVHRVTLTSSARGQARG